MVSLESSPRNSSHLPHQQKVGASDVKSDGKVPCRSQPFPLTMGGLDDLLMIEWTQTGAYSFASAGNGTPQHLVGELFNTAASTKMQHIAYKGAGPALNDVLGAQVPVMFDILASSLPYLKAGKLRPLAVTTKARVPALPDVPPLAESGLSGFEFVAWHGIALPASTPRDIVLKLNSTINATLADPECRHRWQAIVTPGGGVTPDAF